MFLSEPRPTPYDLSFSLLGIPVRVHPLFWLIALIMGFRGDGDPKPVLIWIISVFISILVHEMGHALTIRYYGWSPHVVLYSFGGLAIYNPHLQSHGSPGQKRRNTWTKVIIAFAGPLAGFVLAGIIISIFIVLAINPGFSLFGLNLQLPGNTLDNDAVQDFITYMLFINIFWGVLNLFPIYPLDGGQIARELFVMVDGRNGVHNSLVLSMVVAIGLCVAGFLYLGGLFPLLFGFMAYSNYQELYGPNRYGGNPW